MSSTRAFRLALAVALATSFVFGLLAIQGCGSEAPQTTGRDGVLPQSNATTTPDVKTEDTATTDKAVVEDKKEPKPDTSDADAAVSAAKASATAGNPSIGSLDVLGVEVIGSWARVDLEPSDKSTDGASWLLKKTNGTWTVVDYGTSLIPADYPEAPSGLFQ